MISLTCEWGGDLSVSPTGDIGTVLAQSELQQRIVRRLLTNPGDYIWHLGYGAGLGGYVGEPYSPNNIESTILNQIQHETLVAANPLPAVQINQSMSGPLSTISVFVEYQVVGANTTGSVVLSLSE
jgi:hypothetical protein